MIAQSALVLLVTAVILFRHSLRAGQLTVKGIAHVQPVSFRPPYYNPLLRV